MQTPVYLTEQEAQTVADLLFLEEERLTREDDRPDAAADAIATRGLRDKFRHACGFARVGGSGWALRPAGSDGRR